MKQIYLVNHDLKMGKGKIAAQVAHVAMMWGSHFKGSHEFKWEDIYVKWCVLHGQAKVVLRATTKQMEYALETIPDALHIRDEGRTQVEPGSLTCVGLPPMSEEDVPLWIRELKLL